MKYLIILLIMLFSSASSAKDMVELSQEQKDNCSIIAEIAADVQHFRRTQVPNEFEDYVVTLNQEDVYYAAQVLVSSMVYEKVPAAAPPMAVAVQINGECLAEYELANKYKRKS